MYQTSEEIYELLFARVDINLLEGMYDVVFNKTKDKFFAFTHNTIDKENHISEKSYFLPSGGHSIYGDIADRMKIPLDEHTWTTKSTEECIQQGIYISYGITFTAIYFEKEWFITSNLTYFAYDVPDEEAKQLQHFRGHSVDEMFEGMSFNPYEPLSLHNGEPYIDIESGEFAHLPWMISIIKKEEKEAINFAFRNYISKEIVAPLFKKLRIAAPKKYVEFIGKNAESSIIVFPEHKKFLLIFSLAVAADETHHSQYFIYDRIEEKMYRWLYPTGEEKNRTNEWYGDLINVMAKISSWNDARYFNSARTMDETDFWDNYVFKKENGYYLYLKDIEV